MPLQPPNPDFLSQAPGPEGDSRQAPVKAPRRGIAGFGWQRPAELTGVAFVLLAAVFGMADLIN
ncbi:MAG TPA: hypothetical protein VLL08_14260 [Kineosporiaceae bacterium]|nr:hypothetical protein [Kineosporiaceae bacterium]